MLIILSRCDQDQTIIQKSRTQQIFYPILLKSYLNNNKKGDMHMRNYIHSTLKPHTDLNHKLTCVKLQPTNKTSHYNLSCFINFSCRSTFTSYYKQLFFLGGDNNIYYIIFFTVSNNFLPLHYIQLQMSFW